MKWMLFLTLFWTLGAHAQAIKDGDPEDSDANDVIEEGVVAGAYLIYNCEDKHWTCVIKEDFNECLERRDKDRREGHKFLKCAPIGEFPTKKSCFQRQLFMVSQNHGARVCISDRWKQRELR